MITFDVKVEGSRLHHHGEITLSGGSVQQYRLHIEYGKEWEDFPEKQVYFSDMNGSTSVTVDEDGYAVVPWERLRTPGYLCVTCVAVNSDGTVVYSTIPDDHLMLVLWDEMVMSAEDGYPPTATVSANEVPVNNTYQPILSADYSVLTYDNMIEAVKNRCSGRSLFTWTKIGESVLGRDIVDFRIGSVDNLYHVLAFGNHHAKEGQSPYVLANMVCYILDCIDKNCYVFNTKVAEVFETVCLHIVISDNPDGYELARDPETEYYNLTEEQQANIAEWLESFVQSGRVDLTTATHKGTDLNYADSQELLESCGGDLADYTFRVKDLKWWKANINGVDLHYNCFDENNEAEMKSWASYNTWPSGPAPYNYIGAEGFDQPETATLLTFFKKYNFLYAVSYHQRGPTQFWDYKSYADRPMQWARDRDIAGDLGRITNTPISTSSNGRVGFAGWYYAYMDSQNRGTSAFGAIKEIGSSYSEYLPSGNYDTRSTYQVCPLPAEQLPALFKRERDGMLYLCAKYARNIDSWSLRKCVPNNSGSLTYNGRFTDEGFAEAMLDDADEGVSVGRSVICVYEEEDEETGETTTFRLRCGVDVVKVRNSKNDAISGSVLIHCYYPSSNRIIRWARTYTTDEETGDIIYKWVMYQWADQVNLTSANSYDSSAFAEELFNAVVEGQTREVNAVCTYNGNAIRVQAFVNHAGEGTCSILLNLNIPTPESVIKFVRGTDGAWTVYKWTAEGITATGSSQAVSTLAAAGTPYTLRTIDLSAGTWLVTGTVAFSNVSTTTYRRVVLDAAESTAYSAYNAIQTPAVNGAMTVLAKQRVVTLTAAATYYLRAASGTASTAIYASELTAVRLG